MKTKYFQSCFKRGYFASSTQCERPAFGHYVDIVVCVQKKAAMSPKNYRSGIAFFPDSHRGLLG